MIKINRKLEQVYKQLCKCFPNRYITTEVKLVRYGSGKEYISITAYIEDHRFKQSEYAFSNECDSIEGFIAHINFEMEGIKDWKPIKELKDRI